MPNPITPNDDDREAAEYWLDNLPFQCDLSGIGVTKEEFIEGLAAAFAAHREKAEEDERAVWRGIVKNVVHHGMKMGEEIAVLRDALLTRVRGGE
jgi:hypothetical protein